MRNIFKFCPLAEIISLGSEVGATPQGLGALGNRWFLRGVQEGRGNDSGCNPHPVFPGQKKGNILLTVHCKNGNKAINVIKLLLRNPALATKLGFFATG